MHVKAAAEGLALLLSLTHDLGTLGVSEPFGMLSMLSCCGCLQRTTSLQACALPTLFPLHRAQKGSSWLVDLQVHVCLLWYLACLRIGV